MTRDNAAKPSGERPARSNRAGRVRRVSARRSLPRVRLLCLLLCCAVLLPSSMLASGPRNNSPTKIGARPLTAARQMEAPAGLPDLNEARRRPRYEPRTIPPVPSTRRRCPPANRRCNDDPSGQARPRPTPPAQPRVGQAAPNGGTSVALFAKLSFLALASAALNGGQPVSGLPFPALYGPGEGYSVTDAPPATLPLAAAPPLDPPAGLHVTSTSDTQVGLSWTAASGNYLVERAMTMGGPYAGVGHSATSSFNDTAPSVAHANSYLYRVCAADSGNNCISPYSNVVMATAYSFDDPTIVTYADYQRDNSLTPTPIRLAHVTQLREAVNAVRHLAGRADATWTHPTLVQYQSPVTAADVQDLRDRLGEALSDLGVPVPVYFEQKLLAGPNGTTVKRIHITQLRDNATRGVVGGSGVASGQGTGLTGQYYGDTSLGANDYKLTRTDATVNFDWGAGSPDPSIAVDNFSVRWSGVVVPLYSETYTFYTTTDDGVRLWIDGQLVVDKWVDQGPTEWSGTFAVQAGRAYAIRMEFYEHWGGASAKLQWSSASQAKEVVPQSQLYPCWKEAGQYVSDFYQGALGRQPSSSERDEWAGLLEQAEGGDQLVEQAQDLGRALFNSAEYAARNPDQHQYADAHQYVSDLYHAYVQRDPDQSGWNTWTNQVLAASGGRASVRIAFQQSAEFQEKVRRLCGTAAAARENAGAGYDFSTARLDPDNRTGGGGADPLSRNYNWSIPLVSLPGRAGLDLGLSLSYNSLVWTKDSTGVTFDADDGFPGPGFRLGFPTVEPKFVNPQLQQPGQPTRYSYLLVTPAGARVELRQVGTSGVYESADSSYLQLSEGGALTLTTADGTRLLFAPLGGQYHCYQVEDRNGNYITAGYYSDGRINTVTDTLGRTLTFNYDAYQNLQTITQPWNREVEGQSSQPDELHTWATFGYGDALTLRPLFSNLAVVGDQPGDQIPVLRQVGLSDGSYYKFSYNDWGQVWKVTHYAADSDPATDNHALSTTWLNLPGAGVSPGQAAPLPATQQADCPRFTEERTWIEKGVMNADGEVVTSYSPWSPDMASCDTYLPDRTTVEREVYGTSWRRGLTLEEKTYSVGHPEATPTDVDLRRDVTIGWEHDGAEEAAYPTNPRVKDEVISDPQGNVRHAVTSYQAFTLPLPDGTTCNLPQEVTEYATSDKSAPQRTTHTDYNLSADYTGRHIIGLPSAEKLYAGTSAGTLVSQVEFSYDDAGNVHNDASLPPYLQALPQGAAAAQHDLVNYPASFNWRGNVTRVRRDEVDASGALTGNYTEGQVGYFVTGAVALTRDAAGHLTTVSYADSFYQNVNRSNPSLATFAYPTTVTDPGGFTATAVYNYDMGAATQRQTPLPSGATQPPVAKSYYDGAGRLIKALAVNTGAYTETDYDASMTLVRSYTTVADDSIQNLSDRFYSAAALDGAGRARGTAHDFLGSSGPTPAWDYSAQLVYYDVMGRAVFRSNPTEAQIAGGTWTPAGDDTNGGQWVGTSQTYDWKGRPKVTTNPGGTQRSADYTGCGCAGGEVVALTDEVGRRQNLYSDPLGRQWKAEVLNWNGTVYSTTESTLNALDQPTFVRQFQGTDQSGVFQETANTYDGYGRLQSSHAPDQDAGHSTTYSYNADDTPASVTDARGAVTTYSYTDPRGLLTGVTHALSGSDLLSVTYAYDAAGNRTSMTTGGGAGGSVTYHYDSFSRLTSEDRQFPRLSGTYTLSYGYTLAGQLKSVTDQAGGTSFTYTIDAAGQLTQVDSTGLGASTPLASGVQYRAWGALKHSDFGNGTGVSFGYNSRGMVSSYSLTGVKDLSTGAARPEGSDVQRYADGLVKFASDYQSDAQGSGIRDRAYQYDHAGRLQEAYTGTDARNILGGVSSNVGDGPYRQSYAYDEWDNQRSRTGRYWSQDDSQTDVYAAATGRHAAPWEYDADGRLVSMNEDSPNGLTYVPARHSYDAAGRHSVTTQTTSRPNPSPHSNTILTTAVMATDIYDGDGQAVEHVKVTQLNTGSPTTAATYYLRSSVLGGRIITEYDSSGARQTSNAWAGAEMLGRHTTTGGFLWQQTNPVTGEARETDASGLLTSETHPDTEGVDMGESDPFVDATAGDPSAGGTSQSVIDSMIAKFMPGYGGAQCRLEGFLLGCGFFQSMIASGLVGPGSSDPGVLTIYNNKQHRYVGLAVWDPAAAAMGVDFFRDGHTGYLPAGVSYHSHSATPFSGPGWTAQWQEYINYAWADSWEKDKWDEPTSTLTARNNGSFVPDGTTTLEATPQNPALTPEQVAGLRKDLKDMLANPKCGDFAKALLKQLGNSYSDNALTLFDKVAGMKNGFYGLASAPPFGLGGGTIGGGNASIGIKLSAGDAPILHNATARSLFHELVHVASDSARGFGHPDMAQAAYAVAVAQGYKNVPKPPEPGSKDYDYQSSVYFESRLFDACRLR